MADRATPTGPAALPARVTTPLLTLLTQQSLDEDYLHVAERRAADPARVADDGPAGPRRHLRAAVVLALFGLIVMTAVIQTNRTAGADEADRATLIDRITAERGQVRALQVRLDRLTTADAAARQSLTELRSSVASAQTRQRRLQVRTGYLAVRGPGVRITVSDPPGRSGDAQDAVRDTDLRRLVNGLWEAGAEAIAINGQRISVLSALRNSGVVVNLNYQPLRPPYVVSAIGDPRTLQADLLDTEGGQEFAGLVRQYGFGLDVQNVPDDRGLQLPAAPRRELLSARPVEPTTRPDREEMTP